MDQSVLTPANAGVAPAVPTVDDLLKQLGMTQAGQAVLNGVAAQDDRSGYYDTSMRGSLKHVKVFAMNGWHAQQLYRMYMGINSTPHPITANFMGAEDPDPTQPTFNAPPRKKQAEEIVYRPFNAPKAPEKDGEAAKAPETPNGPSDPPKAPENVGGGGNGGQNRQRR